jgi:hypothetical protein
LQRSNEKPLEEAIAGEDLNVLIGSRPFRSDKGSELVKLISSTFFMKNTA